MVSLTKSLNRRWGYSSEIFSTILDDNFFTGTGYKVQLRAKKKKQFSF